MAALPPNLEIENLHEMNMKQNLHRHAASRHAATPRCLHPAANRSAARSAISTRAAVADWHELPLKHVVDSNQFNKRSMEAIFAEALKMEKVRPGTPESEMLKGYVVSTLFYEPSTRTRLSFESAMGKLGGTVISTESAAEYSSAAKGETLEGGNRA